MPYRARSRQFERRTRETFIWLAIIPVLLFIAVYVSVREFRQSVGAVIRSYRVLASLQALDSALKDAERGQRGYLLTGYDSYLQPYRQAIEEIGRDLNDVRDLASFNPAQDAHIQQLSVAVQAKVGELDRTIKLRQAGDVEGASAVVRSNEGERYMQQVGSIIRAMHRTAQEKLAEREAARSNVEDLLLAVCILATIASLLTLYWTWGQIHNYEKQRNSAEGEVRTLNATLEQRIADRTAELGRTVEDLRRSNRDLEHFAWVASHDLQEPLRNVSTMVQMLEKKYQPQLDDDGRALIHHAVFGAKRMQSLVRDLLSYSRVGVHSIQPATTVLNEVVDGIIREFEDAARQTGAVITRDDLPVVAADRGQLTLVFENLIGNAIKFRGTDAPRIHVSVSRSGADWLFSVSDNGQGFRQEYAERIFVIFQRLHGAEEYPGTGLGLAVSKRIIEAHGGRIWAESQEGAGSTFWFTLPATAPEDKPASVQETIA